MFDCRYRWFNVCCSCMIQSDHVAISTVQELISDGWLVLEREICCWKAEGIPLHCVGCWAIIFYHNWYLMSVFSCWIVQASLECPMCRCQMVHFGYEKKNYTWSELLPARLGRIFHNREWKISQCLKPTSQSACSIWISAFISLSRLKYFPPLISLWLFGAFHDSLSFSNSCLCPSGRSIEVTSERAAYNLFCFVLFRFVSICSSEFLTMNEVQACMKVAWGQWDGKGGDSFKNTNKCYWLGQWIIWRSCELYEAEFVALLFRWQNRLEAS